MTGGFENGGQCGRTYPSRIFFRQFPPRGNFVQMSTNKSIIAPVVLEIASQILGKLLSELDFVYNLLARLESKGNAKLKQVKNLSNLHLLIL